MLDLENPSGGAPPLDSGRPIKVGFRNALRLVIDAGATTMPPEAQPFHSGKSRDGYTLVGTRSVGPSGPGWLGSTTSHLQANTAAGLNDELLQLPANCDFTCQFVVDNVGVASGTPCWFRSGAGASSSNLFLATDTRRPWLRISGTDVLRPASGAQWTDGQTINLIVRNKHATRTEAWWDGALKHSATHSSSIPALTGIEAIYYLLTNSVADELRGNAVAIRFWSRYLGDAETAELAADHGALYETDQVWVPVGAGGSVAITAATETDTAQPIASNQQAVVGLASETDSAFAIASSQRATLGLASETDSAQALAAHQAQTIGLASETDAAQPISTGAVVSVGLASETDTAQALASNQAAAVGLVSETDTAQSISVTGAGTLGTASETDTAQALTANQRRTIGLASETDTAQPISRVEFITVGLASETDTAQPIVSLQRAAIAPALETDTAQAISITGGEPPAPPAPTFQPGYKHNPRTARDLDPLPPTGDDLADLVRDKWDAIERANAAIKRARGAPAQATVPTPAPAPAPRPSKRPAGAIAAAGLPLTEEQLRADEEAFILMVAEIL